jgi:hypothetical protein
VTQVIRRDVDLDAAIRARRGEATGKDAAEVAQETANEDFARTAGKRATAEAATLAAPDPRERKDVEDRLRAHLSEKSKRGPEAGERMELAGSLLAALRARRGEARGMTALDAAVEEHAAHDVPRPPGRGEQATAESQTMGATGYANDIPVRHAVAQKARLGETGLAQVIAEAKARGPGPAWTAPDEAVSTEHQAARGAYDTSITAKLAEIGAVNAHLAARSKLMADALAKAKESADAAATAASWDKASLEAMTKSAADAVAAISTPKPDTTDLIDAKVDVAQPLVGDLAVRAKQDLEWMKLLEPQTEETLDAGLKAYTERNDTSFFNSGMRHSWTYIKNNGGKLARDEELTKLLSATVNNLASEVDRKTAFDKAHTVGLLKGGAAKAREAVVDDLVKRTTVKKSITDIVKAEPDIAKLKPILAKFDKLDGLGYVLAQTPDPAQLAAIVDKANKNLPALRRVYHAAAGNPATVHFWLCGAGAHKLVKLDTVLAMNGEVWRGQTGTPPPFEPAGTTKEAIEAVAVPMVGASRPPTDGYAGNRTYGNAGGPPDMLLPTVTAAGAAITYTEFDIKQYRPGRNRGASRFVKGSDGRYYRTDDHYATFTKFA